MRATRPLLRSITSAAVLAVAASLLVTSPAQAETRNTYDPIGDATLSGDPDFPGREGVEASADIRRLRVDTTEGIVTAVITVADLTLASTDYTSASVRFVSNLGDDRRATLRGEGSRKRAVLTDDATGQPVECDGLEVRRSARKDQYSFSLPASCLGDEVSSFQFGALVLIGDVTSGNPACCPNSYIDDARRDGRLGKRIKLGNRAVVIE
ncbi:hypothetical protein [Nocardioides sp. CFH 31398]|uniref:hypothetical protein n=1 Tax=Nocardioides sp. CFH 31398 TaxID=2919579 RepID=UPI001F05BC42|nr:hypothetical protein [Nocardioides sp. CFH 31398]MCH1867547.1 hypothetical protein [Nocardioides sp. CFH 31398]